MTETTKYLAHRTSEQVKQAFLTNLQAVIDKWGAEINVRQESMYEMPTMEVWIPAVWDDNGEIVRDSAGFDLGDTLMPTRGK